MGLYHFRGSSPRKDKPSGQGPVKSTSPVVTGHIVRAESGRSPTSSPRPAPDSDHTTRAKVTRSTSVPYSLTARTSIVVVPP
jgi:hypothetical protein